VAVRPATGVHTVVMHGIVRLPICAGQKGCNASLNGRYAPGCLGVARIDIDPDAPYIFPTLPTYAVEEGVLQIAGLVEIPAIADVDHVPRLEPFVPVDHGNQQKGVLSPGHHVPTESLVAGSSFRLKDQRVTNLVC